MFYRLRTDSAECLNVGYKSCDIYVTGICLLRLSFCSFSNQVFYVGFAWFLHLNSNSN